jgi:hypothetical protein
MEKKLGRARIGWFGELWEGIRPVMDNKLRVGKE